VANQVWSNEGVLVQDTPNCLLCGQEGVPLYQGLRDRLFEAPGVWSLMECKRCGLFWLNPMPLPSEILKLYKTYYTHTAPHYRPRWRELIKTSVLAAYYGYPAGGGNRVLGFFLSMLGPIRERVGASVLFLHARDRGKLLDVGCGDGRFLAWMSRLGWEGVGVDLDGVAVQTATERFGVTAFEGTIESTRFPTSSFDVVTMHHVFEHLSDPMKTLAECYRVLRPGGKLVIVTPNAESLASRLSGPTWLGWDPPRHLFIFSQRALHELVIRSGFTVCKLHTLARWAYEVRLESRMIGRQSTSPRGFPSKIPPLLKLEAILFCIFEYILIQWRDVGEELLMIATK